MSLLVSSEKPKLAAPESEFDRFVYTVSHDLQEPLRMISSFVHLLNVKCDDDLSNDCNQYLEYITENTDRMKKMIYSLVDYSRVDRNQEEIRELDPTSVINDILSMYSQELSVCECHIEIGNLPKISGQPTLIICLLKHLLRNSFESFVEGRPLMIKISCEDKNDHWQFCVEDNGCGIPLEHSEHVFEMFRKINRPEKNLGSGLAISRSIVRKHGGKIFVGSPPDVGTLVYFALPK
jgi:light-regulated signal transduction histidine kinase (bacteriophytochrome)